MWAENIMSLTLRLDITGKLTGFLLLDTCITLMLLSWNSSSSISPVKEGFSRLYNYHVRLLMHFTRVRMMNLPYFICRNIEKMALYVQRKPFSQQFNNIYHFSLIKIVILHQLSLLNIPWDTFIAHEIFKGPQVIPSVPQEEGGTSE